MKRRLQIKRGRVDFLEKIPLEKLLLATIIDPATFLFANLLQLEASPFLGFGLFVWEKAHCQAYSEVLTIAQIEWLIKPKLVQKRAAQEVILLLLKERVCLLFLDPRIICLDNYFHAGTTL